MSEHLGILASDMAIGGEKFAVIDVESCTNAAFTIGCNAGEGKNLLSKVWSGFAGADGPMRGEEAISPGNRLQNCTESRLESGEALLMDKKVGGDEKAEKTMGIEKPKKKNCKKPPKPPRPPRPLSLDSADQKLIRELSELAMLKRARIERMKALKKLKNGKAASSSSVGNTFALVVTLIFCIVIIWQGVFPRGSSIKAFQGYPLSPVETDSSRSFIAIQLYRNVSTNSSST